MNLLDFNFKNCFAVWHGERIRDLFDLVWSIPTSKLAKQLGVSDVAISKRCKQNGIEKPGPGYWRKIETNLKVVGEVFETPMGIAPAGL